MVVVKLKVCIANGSRNKATLAVQELFDTEAETIGRKAIELALAGDMTAIRLVLERILPPRRDMPINIELPDIAKIEDTTSVNTGKKNGVVVILQRMFTEKRINKPQFISCQHHVLDRILRLVMDEELGNKTQLPNIEYPFVSQLLKEYEQLKTQFDNGTEVILETSGWRDDMKFLFHLTRVFPLIRF